MVEGKQMHKSKGNFITMKGAVEKYGADATRCALLLGAEGMDDPDWRAENVNDLKTKFESLSAFAKGILRSAKSAEDTTLERWLQSKLQHKIKEVTVNIEELKTRTALSIALFELWNDFRWYVQRKGNTDTKALADAVKVWLRMLAPFAPFTCEELWSQSGESGFISLAQWPEYEELKVDITAEERENLIIDVMSDTSNILKAMKITPKRVCYYVAAPWKWKVYLKVLDKTLVGEAKINELMKEFASDQDLRRHMKEVASIVPKIIKSLTRIANDRKANILKIKEVDEREVLKSAQRFLKDRFNAEIFVYGENEKEAYDPKHRAVMSMPNQPAIYIE
jgi:leucyl-tRNA synthetase